MKTTTHRGLVLLLVAVASQAFQPAHVHRRIPAATHSPVMPTTPEFNRQSLLVLDGSFESESASLRPPKHHLWANLQMIRKRTWSTVRSVVRGGRKGIMVACLMLTMLFARAQHSWAAPSSGRAGGSFKAASRPAVSRPARSYSSSWSKSRRPTVILRSNPRRYGHRGLSPGYGWESSRSGSAIATTAEKAGLITLTGVAIYGMAKNQQKMTDSGPLGSGATMASITVALNVPDPDHPSSILKRLRKFTLGTDTSKRSDVQELISSVALELVRQERSIVSASSSAEHFRSINLAERSFQSKSVMTRSKFEREVVNKFGNRNDRDEAAPESSAQSKPTKAVVTINLAIEGDSLSKSMPSLQSRENLLALLSQLAVDAKTDECLLSAEVIWSPEAIGDRLTDEDLYADFPDLIPI